MPEELCALIRPPPHRTRPPHLSSHAAAFFILHTDGFWLPSVLSRLGKSKGEAGAIGSALEMSYGACSLVNGVLIDARSPRTLLIVGLLLTCMINVVVSVTDLLPAMAALWAVNGAVQSLGWPCVTNVFLAWFPDPAARGAWYSLLSTCQNAGAALVPLVVVASINSFGWQAALWAPALLALATALLLFICLHGSPEDAARAARRKAGLPTDDHDGAAQKLSSSRPPLATLLGRQIVLNTSLWVMAASYFSVSLVRSYLSDWSSVYLTEQKGLSLQEVARCLFLLEAGGFGGSLAAGALSDRLFAGRRGPVVAICSALLAPCMLALRTATAPLALQLIYAGLGFCAFPVHVLLGLFSREVVPPAVSSSAGGFVKCIAQVRVLRLYRLSLSLSLSLLTHTTPFSPPLRCSLLCADWRCRGRLPSRPLAAGVRMGWRAGRPCRHLRHFRRHRVHPLVDDGRRSYQWPLGHHPGL